MYFLIKGMCEDGPFEWIVEAEDEKKAAAQLENGEQLVSIREIFVSELVKREEEKLLGKVRNEYILQLHKDTTIREWNKIKDKLYQDENLYYIALKTFNTRQRFEKILRRRRNLASMTVAKFDDTLSQLMSCKTEEEVELILDNI